jgi:hypothetical protein
MLNGQLNDPQKIANQTTTSSTKSQLGHLPCWLCFLVPTARLELAQLAPLPPQDSVSTNFTTSAKTNILTCFGPFVQWTFHLNE